MFSYIIVGRMLLIDECSFKLIIKRLTFHHFIFHHFNHNIIMCDTHCVCMFRVKGLWLLSVDSLQEGWTLDDYNQILVHHTCALITYRS